MTCFLSIWPGEMRRRPPPISNLLQDVEAALETDQWQMRAYLPPSNTDSHSGASLNRGAPVLNSGKQPDQRSAPGIHARGQLLAAARANWRAAGPCKWSHSGFQRH
ncbi:hypothetical protein DEGR_36180 (plasmid) [Deinococcus grandis]|nr:hypothetical protein DEGR_36180 [Deinococcus grandis]